MKLKNFQTQLMGETYLIGEIKFGVLNLKCSKYVLNSQSRRVNLQPIVVKMNFIKKVKVLAKRIDKAVIDFCKSKNYVKDKITNK